MKLKRCENLHYYDGDIYTTCPHCAEAEKADSQSVQKKEADEKKNLRIEPDNGRKSEVPSEWARYAVPDPVPEPEKKHEAVPSQDNRSETDKSSQEKSEPENKMDRGNSAEEPLPIPENYTPDPNDGEEYAPLPEPEPEKLDPDVQKIIPEQDSERQFRRRSGRGKETCDVWFGRYKDGNTLR